MKLAVVRSCALALLVASSMWANPLDGPCFEFDENPSSCCHQANLQKRIFCPWECEIIEITDAGYFTFF